MKTLKQLEAEVEELYQRTNFHRISSWKIWQGDKDRLLLKYFDEYLLALAVCTQTEEIIEMIEKELSNSLGKKKILTILKGIE